MFRLFVSINFFISKPVAISNPKGKRSLTRLHYEKPKIDLDDLF